MVRFRMTIVTLIGVVFSVWGSAYHVRQDGAAILRLLGRRFRFGRRRHLLHPRGVYRETVVPANAGRAGAPNMFSGGARIIRSSAAQIRWLGPGRDTAEKSIDPGPAFRHAAWFRQRQPANFRQSHFRQWRDDARGALAEPAGQQRGALPWADSGNRFPGVRRTDRCGGVAKLLVLQRDRNSPQQQRFLARVNQGITCARLRTVTNWSVHGSVACSAFSIRPAYGPLGSRRAPFLFLGPSWPC